MEAVFRWIEALPDERVLGDISAAARYLAGREDVRHDRVAVLGFCLGGQYAVMAACRTEGLAACVSFYGMLRYTRRLPNKPASPLDMAKDLKCPMLGLYGEEDALIPGDDVAELGRILASADKSFELISFAGAGHAFLNDERPEAYRPQAAAEAWQRATRFLRKTLAPVGNA
jgi:carboxymethylenebutenolidase